MNTIDSIVREREREGMDFVGLRETLHHIDRERHEMAIYFN